MAIFGKSNQKPIQNITSTTTIAKGTKIEGNLMLECNLNNDGHLEGDIICLGGVTIGQSGIIEGTVKGDRVIVSGFLKGDIECNYMEILKGGRVEGSLLSANFTVENGGIFEGTSKIKEVSMLELEGEKPKIEEEKKVEQKEKTPKKREEK